MGKRELIKKERMPRDLYPTVDPDAVAPLTPFILGSTYYEPCYGKGDLTILLNPYATCVGYSDIQPQDPFTKKKNCLSFDMSFADKYPAEYFITNPPYKREMLLPILDHLPHILPTWLLLPADMMHNKYMTEHLKFCSAIVSIGRLYWFLGDNGEKIKGVDNYAWYLFDKSETQETIFYGRDWNI